MEPCPSCNSQYKRNKKHNHELTKTHLAANYRYYCQECRRERNVADKKSHLQAKEHKII